MRHATKHHGTSRPANSNAQRALRVQRVELVAVTRGRGTVVTVRSVRPGCTGRALFTCAATDARGAEFAMRTAERYCTERGYVLAMPAPRAQGAQGAQAAQAAQRALSAHAA